MSQVHRIYAFLFMSVFLATTTQGLKCYTCSVTEDESDTQCADDVTTMANSITDCDKKYCTITRIEYIDPKGKLASLSRNCVDSVPSDGITEDSTFRTYQRSCTSDLCNSGTGKSDSNAAINYLGDKSLIIAPGTGRSSAIRIAYTSSISVLHVLTLTIIRVAFY